MKGIIRKLSPFLKPYMKVMVIMLAVGAVGSVINVFVPDLIKDIANVIDEGMDTGIDMSQVITYGAEALAAIIAVFCCNTVYGRGMAKIGKQVGHDVRNSINDKINRTTIAKLDSLPPGDLLVKSVLDVTNIETFVSRALGTFVSNIVIILGCVVMMLTMSPLMTLCVIAAVALGTVASMFINIRSIPMLQKQRAAEGVMNAQIDEALTGHMLIKAFNAEDEVIEAFEKNSDALMENSGKTQFISSVMSPVMSFINNLSYVLVVIVGASLALSESSDVTVGIIIAFVLYAKMISSPVSTIASAIPQFMQVSVSADKILEILDMPENEDETKTDSEPAKVSGKVEFDNIRFGYVEGHEIIHGFSAEIDPGMKVAIVGPTGAGKSTIINLLMRFYELNSGNIKIDGVPITDMSRSRLHDMLGMVLQETWVFNGTIRDNIVYSTENVTDEKLDEVIKLCGLDYLIGALPEGLDTVLSDDSVSAGQKQLITIARVMLKNPDILILDEATSSIDTRTELLIQNALDELTKGKTSFVIAHRLSTIKNADVIFVLKDGDILETGSHEELMKKGGFYTDLYNSQWSSTRM